MIRTTHAGSLPRPTELDSLFAAKSRGEAIDEAALDLAVTEATSATVQRQIETGIDIVNDGEQGRESFFTYVRWRMQGFGERSRRRPMADMVAFPEVARRRRAPADAPQVNLMRPPAAISEVTYTGETLLRAELDRFDAASAGCEPGDRFVTAPSPGIIAAAMDNRAYATEAAYVDALADALATEYRTIVERGFLLQIDAPDLAMERHGSYAERPLREYLAFVELVLGAIDRALSGLDRARVRLHVCWGNYNGPHTHDVDLADVLPTLKTLEVGGLLLSMANPRHAHEHRVIAERGLRDGCVLLAGVIDTTTNYVEHPEVVAERLQAAVRAMGGDPTKVIAAPDCGFATAAGFGDVATEVAWAKLASLVEGAQLASSRLT